jgi:TATA-binding protein-associated factor Taf7
MANNITKLIAQKAALRDDDDNDNDDDDNEEEEDDDDNNNNNLSVVLCGCHSWSLTLREDHKLRVFKNMLLRNSLCLRGIRSYCTVRSLEVFTLH